MTVPFHHRGLMGKRQADLSRINDMTVKVTRVSGRLLVVGSGEAALDLKFPVVFSERPIMSFGGELAEDSHAQLLQYPTVSAVVAEWTIVNEVPGFEGRYIGCRLAVVTSGQSTQQMWVHYGFEGKAIRNPLNNVGDTDGSI